MVSACARLPVMPCCTMATGQPAVGLPGQVDVAFGIVTTIGTVTSATLAGVGLNMVKLRLVASMPGTGEGPAAVQNLVRIAALSVGLAGGVR